MADYIYYFDKITHTRILLGEIQKNFNMGFGIDGTKDSCKVIVKSFVKEVIEPNTIIFHANTETWWVVDNDKVDRYLNEGGDFIYDHEIQLVGAMELLNARDLTDSGFNQSTYTVGQFINRLFALSNFEFETEIETNGNIYLGDNIDYIKTFENYTLLSALRELLDGYNLVGKLSFNTLTQGQNVVLNKAKIDLISKAGNVGEVIDSDFFVDSRENRNINKNSFGTVVVSNAENVISTKAKTFPTIGSVKLSGNSNTISNSNALVRLPSNINKINWIKLSRPTVLQINATWNGTTYISAMRVDVTDKYALNKAFEKLALDVKDDVFRLTDNTSYSQEAYNIIKRNKSKILKPYYKAQTITLYTGWRYDPISHNYIAPTDNPDFYFPEIKYTTISTSWQYTGKYVVAEKQIRDTLQYTNSCLYYTRGENTISGFNYIRNTKDGETSNEQFRVSSYLYTDLRDATYDNNHIYWSDRVIAPVPVILEAYLYKIDEGNQQFTIFSTKVIVNYIPMSDLKVKLDNTKYDKDIHIYNQNGKLTDSVALSKLLNSYTKEIQSDNITKYGNYYDFNSIPKVGTIVNDNGEKYVINHISLDFNQNENYEYYINAEFTLSKFVATKSLLTNPNSNIRDYGIPQNNNVVRKQVYRDFYELENYVDSQSDNNEYLGLNKVLNLGNNVQNLNEHKAIIKMTFDNAYGGDGSTVLPKDHYYYQLDTTTYILKKAIYEVVDFKDNNIIGYGSQNVSCGFDIRRIFTGVTDLIATPISYVDDNGKAKGIEICFTTIDQITDIYDKYVDRKNQQYQTSFSGSIYNYSVFIDEEIFEGTNATENFSYQGTFTYGRITSYYIGSVDLTEKGLGLTGNPQDYRISLSVRWDNQSCPIREGFTFLSKDSNDHYILNFQFTQRQSLSGDPTMNLVLLRNYKKDGALQNNDFVISEPNYGKDALEVPFFEYCCQIDDSETVLIGDNILDNNEEDKGYFYQYFLAPKGIANNNNFMGLTQPQITFDETIIYNNACEMEYTENGEIAIKVYTDAEMEITDNSVEYGNQVNFNDLDLENNDLVIIRIKTKDTENWKKDLMFVIQKGNEFDIENNSLLLKINHYRLK